MGYLSGLADGERCFFIGVNGRYRTSFMCVFTIGMRSDDRPLLEHLRATTGVGRLYEAKPNKGLEARPGMNPTTHWRVSRLAECFRLVEIFDQFPLQSKKAGDFSLWREAVSHWAERNWLEMEELREQMQQHREFRPLEVVA